jgi:Tol biopolymer transport system component
MLTMRSRRGSTSKLIVFTVLAVLSAVVVTTPIRGGTQTGHVNGRIAYDRPDPASSGDLFVYTANPDGSHVARLVSIHVSGPHWSHTGSRLTVSAQDKDGRVVSATIGADGSNYKPLSIDDPTLNVACNAWSSGDTRLACESWDDSNSARNGIYTISSSDGSGLTRLTNAHGGHDQPGAYSPNGKQLVFARFGKNGSSIGLFVVNANGTHLRRITPPGTLIQDGNDGDWSPRGNEIVFSRHVTAAQRGSIWVIRSNGRGLRKIHVRGITCGGSGLGCHEPHWSPDGRKITFAANSAAGSNIYTVKADGSGATQVAHDGDDDDPAWGTNAPT